MQAHADFDRKVEEGLDNVTMHDASTELHSIPTWSRGAEQDSKRDNDDEELYDPKTQRLFKQCLSSSSIEKIA